MSTPDEISFEASVNKQNDIFDLDERRAQHSTALYIFSILHETVKKITRSAVVLKRIFQIFI